MKKKLYLISFLIIFFSIIFLSSKSYRYIGINFVVKKIEISNFKKLSEFYQRHLNYKKLVKKITIDSKNKKEEIIDISKWVYENIRKPSSTDVIIDNHPWTIVERKMGASDQFSDILSVLLVYNNNDSFFLMSKNRKIFHPVTFFKYNNDWSIIDPFYGVYFTNNKKEISTLQEIKNNDSNMQHLVFNKITPKNLGTIFFDKKFKDIKEVNNYYKDILLISPDSKSIDNENIYVRGGRSHVQKPIHRIIFQLQRLIK